MKKQNKKLLLTFILCILNISLFAGSAFEVTDGYYWDYSYDIPTSYDLIQIDVSNIESGNGNLVSPYQGYYMGQFTVDFSKNSENVNDAYFEVLKDETKDLDLVKDQQYYYQSTDPKYSVEYWKGRVNISDADGNGSTVSGFVKVTETNYETNSSKIIWFDITRQSKVDLTKSSYFGDVTTQKFTFDYYFIINNINILDPTLDWTINSPSPSISSSNFATIQTKVNGRSNWQDITWNGEDQPPENTTAAMLNDCTNTVQYITNPVYRQEGNLEVGNPNSIADIYNLNIKIEKIFNDSTTNFFDGELHKYYSLYFESYKYGEITDDPFSVVLQISSAHNWYLHLDNQSTPIDSEKIGYDLYLRYGTDSSYSQLLVQNNQDKILIKNIVSSNESSIIYLMTKSDQARVDSTTKGEYQDTVYINFITDGWSDSNESSFADKIITLP